MVQILHQQEVVMVDHIDQVNKQVDQVVDQDQDNLQAEQLVIHHPQTHPKEIQGVMEQVKDQFHLEQVEVVEVQPLLVLMLVQDLVEMEVQEHQIQFQDLMLHTQSVETEHLDHLIQLEQLIEEMVVMQHLEQVVMQVDQE
tara:strand:- start:3 stop:425 length:423 start_codon:yes stop_codon:yes gene_type:complete